jgi:FixJ family two-component response regulator
MMHPKIDLPQASGHAAAADQGNGAVAAARSLRVAILDDDPSVRTAISRLVGASGMVGSSFSNGMELFNALPKVDPDCIILDLYMPGLDGLEVLSYLRKTGLKAPVIMITAQDDPTLRETCLKAGASAFLRKPLQAAELLATIAQAAHPGH